MAGRISIGTSGFFYQHWQGILYPEEVPQRLWLETYAEVFDTVEINATYYRLPKKTVVAGWFDRTPEDFLFSVKGSRFITHIKRLDEVQEAVDTFLDRLSPLKDKLGSVLFQLPPSMKIDTGKLDLFLQSLPPKKRFAFEFRDPSWFDEAVYAFLRDKGAAMCLHDYRSLECSPVLTADWTYLRFHGPTGRYAGVYGKNGLKVWADRIADWLTEGIDVFVYFNNDAEGNAVRDALTMADLLGIPGTTNDL